MRIGIVSNLYPPHERGGAELVARRVADELSRRGHHVSVLTTQPYRGRRSLRLSLQERHLEHVYRFHPMNIYGVESLVPRSFFTRLLWHAIDAWSPGVRSVLTEWIEEEQLDVVITHNLKGIGLSIGRILQSLGIKHVHTLHDVQLTVASGLLMWGEEETGLNRSWLRLWYERLTQWAIGHPDLVLSPSEFLRDLHEQRGFFDGSSIEVLPNPAPSVVVPLRSAKRFGPVRLLFAGQLEPHKGILFLLETLSAMDVSWELHIAGDGSLRSQIEAMCRGDKRLTFHGFVALNPLLKLIAAMDAVVVPSLCYENSPTVIYESFAVGVPVIASRIGGVPELIEDGVNGCLFLPGDQESFFEAVKLLFDDPDVCWQKASEIRVFAERFGLKRYADRLQGYLDLLTCK